MNNDSSTHYRIFILTVWSEAETDAPDPATANSSAADPATWRIRLEESKTKVSVGCVGINGLVDLLSRQIMVKSTKTETTINDPKT